MSASVAIREPPARFTLRADTLAQSVVILLGMSVLQRAVGFGRSILFCRWIEPEQLGQWDLTYAFLELAAPIAVLSLPACFGRYVEHYRQRDQLRTFLWRTFVAIGLLTAAAVALLVAGRSWFSYMLYGHSAPGLMGIMIFTLPALIVYNSLGEVFSGLRMYRVASGLQFVQSLLFAVLGVALVRTWSDRADSILLAFGVACALCSLLPLYWLAQTWRHMPAAAESLPQTVFWAKLLPFVASVWVSNWLGNLFTMADRYMIIHYSGMNADEALAAVGQYHSARVVPLLLITLAALISGMLVPFMSHEWEAGRREAVSARINSFLKVTGLSLTAAAALVMVASPLLFGWAFAGKFDAGLGVLPLTLTFSVWFGMFLIAKTYLWCDERVWLVSVGFALGIAVNLCINSVLLPRLGWQGAVVATCAATLVMLLVTYAFVSLRGMPINAGTWFVSALPAVLWLGPWFALGSLMAVAGLAARGEWIFDRREKEQLAAVLADYWGRICSHWSRWNSAAGSIDV